MNLIDSNVLRLLHGDPIFFKDICLIYSPTLGEIATAGLQKFYSYISIIAMEKPLVEEEEVKQLLKQLSDFEYLLFLAQMDTKTQVLIKEAFRFFTHEEVQLVTNPVSIVFGDLSEKRILTSDLYEEFKQQISLVTAMFDKDENDIKFLDSDSPQVRAMKIKLLEGRKLRKQLKEKQAKKDSSDIQFSDLVSSLCIGSNGSINMLNVWGLTYYAFQDQVKRMSWHEEFDINTRAAMAGAKVDKNKLTHWIKSMTFK